MADISIINKDNTNYNVKDAVGREALAVVENKGAKNIAEVTAVSSTAGGVDYIVNPDGTVIANRTASSTSSTWFRLNESLSLKAGTYVLSGGKNSGERVLLSPTTSLSDAIADSQGSGAEFTLTEDTDNLIYAIRVAYTDSPSNVKFYPMICSKTEWDISNAFVPHGKTNAELTLLEKQDRAGLATTIDKGAKNLLKLGFTHKSAGTQTADMTADGNGIIVNGDRNTTTDVILVYDLVTNQSNMLDTRYTLPAGKYVIPSTGTSNLRYQVYCHDGTNYQSLGYTMSNPLEFEYTSALKAQYPYIAYRLWASRVSSFDNFTVYPMVCSKAEWDISQAYVPYAKTNAELTNDTSTLFTENTRQETEIGVVANAGAKNLLPMTHTGGSITRYGVTCTWDLNAGTMTLNGTHSSGDSAAIFEFYDGSAENTKILPAGSYVLSGCPAGGSTSSYRAVLTQITGAVDVGNGVNFELLEPHYAAYRILISGNVTFNNMVFKPMIRPSAITDPTFQPFARSNPALTAEMDYVVNAGAKNLAPIETRTNKTGNKWIVGADSGNTEPINLIAGDYIFTAVSSSTGSGQCQIKLAYSDGTTALTTTFNFGSTMTLTFTASKDVVGYGIYCNPAPVTFKKMMIRPAAITDPTFQPFARTNRDLTVLTDEDRASLVELVDGGAKSLLNPEDTVSDKSLRGVTVTRSGDVYSFSGTAEDNSNIFININNDQTINNLPAGDYVAIFEQQQTDIKLQVGINGTITFAGEFGEPLFFTIPSTATSNWIRFFFVRLVNYNGRTARIMICTKAAWKISQRFQPYRPSWQEGCFGRGSSIKSTDDCNNFTEVGTYYAGSSTSVPASNSPFQSSGFRLRVEDWYQYQDGITGKIQIADTYINASTYTERRRIYFYTGGGVGWRWTDWATTISQSMTPA